MYSTHEVAGMLGLGVRAVQLHCVKLNFPKTGRDYRLTDVQVTLMKDWILSHPVGRPKVIKGDVIW